MILKESFKLINRTRIFISSAYEDALKDTRKIVKDHLEKSGHEVPIFEDGDFGSWRVIPYNNGYWLYEFDIARSQEQAKNISALLSTSLRSVVNLIPERTKLNELKNQTANLMNYANYTLTLLSEKT